MVEQSHTCERHCDTVLITALDHKVITDRAAGLCDIGDAASVSALDVIAEWEEGIRAYRYTLDGCKIFLLFLKGKGLGLRTKILLPVAVSANVLFVFVDIAVDNVISVGTTESIKERVSRKGRFRTLSCWRRNHVSALPPASLVQWILDC